MNPSIFTSTINSYLPEPHASLLNGILFGVSLKTTKVFYEQLKMVGLLHIVVLSGINITILAAIIASFTSFLPKKASIVITIIIIIIFIFFVGPKPPIVRAAFMGILSLFAILYGKKYIAAYILFLSAFFILIIRPEWIKGVSFQLSYGATLGIILFGPAIKKSVGLWGDIKYFIWKDLKPSLSAQLFTVPIIFYYFKQISFIAPLSNLLVAPLIPILMIFGFLTAILGKISFILGFVPSLVCYVILSSMVFVIETLSKLPFAFHQF